MRKKLNRDFVLIAAVAIILTGVLATVTYYRAFRTEVLDNLKTYTHVLAHSMDENEKTLLEHYRLEDEEIRVTLVSADGTVLMDSNANIGDLPNHADRPEIVEAFRTGEGEDVRKSETLQKSTFYYAMRLDNGNVIRMAKESGSIFSLFMRTVPSFVLIAFLLIVLSTILAGFLTRSFVAPIGRIASNMEAPINSGIYEELFPFLETIREQHQNLLQSAKMRQDFTANVTHELKTPLTAISGYAELIESGIAPEKETKRFAREIHRSANRLLHLINDILQLSELDSSETAPETEKLNLYGLAYTCVEMLRINAEQNHLTVQMTGDFAWIKGNRSLIEELLYNLCSNAIRYNKEGGAVEVHVEETPKGALLRVSDTGIGIAKEHQERIFERFYRVDKSRSKARGGTGLGLAIVKHIVAEHQAEVKLESELGKGTTITVLFPKYIESEV